PVGLDCMGMFPASKRPTNLHVSEATARFDVFVLGSPASPKRAEPQLEFRSRTLANRMTVLEHAPPIPRRREPLQPARAHIPGPPPRTVGGQSRPKHE